MLYQGFFEGERKLMYRCSFLYYRAGLTQKEIGERFGITRQKVSDYLKRAAEVGIVYIKAPRVYELESELIKELLAHRSAGIAYAARGRTFRFCQ